MAKPRRSCVVCRAADEPKNLLRFVVSQSALTVDEQGILPGRGAYCHRTGSCITHPKLAEALVQSLTRRAKSQKVSVERVLEQFGPAKPAQKDKKSRMNRSNKIRL